MSVYGPYKAKRGGDCGWCGEYISAGDCYWEVSWLSEMFHTRRCANAAD